MMEGWQDFRPSTTDKGRIMVLHGIEIDRGKVPEYFTVESENSVELWYKYKLFGFRSEEHTSELQSH